MVPSFGRDGGDGRDLGLPSMGIGAAETFTRRAIPHQQWANDGPPRFH